MKVLPRAIEVGSDNYDEYCGVTCQSVAVDHRALIEALSRLVEDPSLRVEMGRQGKLRARQEFDWPVIIGKYFELWEQLADIRNSYLDAADRPAPRVAPGRRDPFDIFASYPSASIDGNTRVVKLDLERDWAPLREHWLFSYAAADLPAEDVLASLLAAIESDPGRTIEALSQDTNIAIETAVLALAWLAKVGSIGLET